MSPVRTPSSSRQWRRLWASPELVCVILIFFYVSLIFIVPPAVNVYFDAVERRADNQVRAGAAARPAPDRQYRLEKR